MITMPSARLYSAPLAGPASSGEAGLASPAAVASSAAFMQGASSHCMHVIGMLATLTLG
jgi:hypothetical protein